MAQEPSSVHSHFQKKIIGNSDKKLHYIGLQSFRILSSFCFFCFFVPNILHWLGFWFLLFKCPEIKGETVKIRIILWPNLVTLDPTLYPTLVTLDPTLLSRDFSVQETYALLSISGPLISCKNPQNLVSRDQWANCFLRLILALFLRTLG